MNAYRIVCVVTKGRHRHVKKVGLGRASSANLDRMMSVQKVRAMVSDGDLFYTVGRSREQIAFVIKGRCNEAGCKRRTLKFVQTGGDDVSKDNLDHLPSCPE